MNINKCLRNIGLLAMMPGMMLGGCVSTPSNNTSSGPITIAQQGSFFVGGKKVQGVGSYDPTQGTANTDPGQTYWIDQMYVQY